jgi:hypothetical protein
MQNIYIFFYITISNTFMFNTMTFYDVIEINHLFFLLIIYKVIYMVEIPDEVFLVQKYSYVLI